jgi:hypothetical protein
VDEIDGPGRPDPMSRAAAAGLIGHDGDLRDRDPDGRIAAVA